MFAEKALSLKSHPMFEKLLQKLLSKTLNRLSVTYYFRRTIGLGADLPVATLTVALPIVETLSSAT